MSWRTSDATGRVNWKNTMLIVTWHLRWTQEILRIIVVAPPTPRWGLASPLLLDRENKVSVY